MPGVKHPRGTQVRLELISWDELDLTVQARVLEVSVISDVISDDMDEESEPGVQNEMPELSEISGESAAIETAEPQITAPPNPE
jgi:exoribonuclease-2